jgi:preprotein translocase subunit SecD
MLERFSRRLSLPVLSILLLLVVAGCGSHGLASKSRALQLEIRPVRTAAFPGGTAVRFAATGETFYLTPEVLVTNADLREAAVGLPSEGSGYGVVLRFSDEAGTRLTTFTAQAAGGQRLAVLLDHELVMAPSAGALLSRDVVLEAGFSEAEARYLVGALAR